MENELYHWRTKGSKNGIRLYQNEDGSYKPGAEGRYDPEPTGKRRGTSDDDTTHYKVTRSSSDISEKEKRLAEIREENDRLEREINEARLESDSRVSDISESKKKSSGMKYVVAALAAGAAVYGIKKYIDKRTGVNVEAVTDAITSKTAKQKETVTKGLKEIAGPLKEATKNSVKDTKKNIKDAANEAAESIKDFAKSNADKHATNAIGTTKIDDKVVNQVLKDSASARTSQIFKDHPENDSIPKTQVGTGKQWMYYALRATMAHSGTLYHHGIKGQKWGVRRYQNPDGTLTEAGKRHYSNKYQLADRAEKVAKAVTATQIARAAVGSIGAGIARATTLSAFMGSVGAQSAIAVGAKFAATTFMSASLVTVAIPAAVAVGLHYVKKNYVGEAYNNIANEQAVARRLDVSYG